MAVDRLNEIIELLKVDRTCSIEQLANHFNVSKETIRRDVRQLESFNRLVKFHGGIRLPDPIIEPPYHKRVNLNAERKKAIAAKAVELVKDGMTIFIDSGSTSYWFAQALTKPLNLQVITNSLDVASVILGRNNWRVILVSGQLDPEYRASFGYEAISQSRRFTPDLHFFSVGAVDAQMGFLDFIIDEANFKRSLLPQAKKCVVLTDSSKFKRQGAVYFADFNQFDMLITDQQPEGDLAFALNNASVEVITVTPAADDE